MRNWKWGVGKREIAKEDGNGRVFHFDILTIKCDNFVATHDVTILRACTRLEALTGCRKVKKLVPSTGIKTRILGVKNS